MSTKTSNPKGPTPPQHTCDNAGALLYPDTDQEFRERVNEKAGGTSGERFEAAAGRHNQAEILRAEGSVNRACKGRNSAISGDAVEDQVKYSCSVCGKSQPGEVDHVGEARDGKKDLVECKTGETFNPAASPDETQRNINQMARLGESAAAGGMGVTYKVPAGHTQAASQIQQTASGMGMNVSVVFV